MKKYLILLVILFAGMAIFAADETTQAPANTVYDNSGTPNNMAFLQLYDNTSQDHDTMATTTMVLHGPFALTKSTGEPMYKSFTVRHHPITGTSPTAAIAYQITYTSNIADTITGDFVTFDTLDATGGSKAVDLSGKAGRFVYFRIDNYDGTETIIDDFMEVIFKNDLDYNINK